MGEQVQVTVPELPWVECGVADCMIDRMVEYVHHRPASAGDQIEVECPGTSCAAGDLCPLCDGSGSVTLTLIEDPEQTFVRMGFGVDGYGWLLVGVPEVTEAPGG